MKCCTDESDVDGDNVDREWSACDGSSSGGFCLDIDSHQCEGSTVGGCGTSQGLGCCSQGFKGPVCSSVGVFANRQVSAPLEQSHLAFAQVPAASRAASRRATGKMLKFWILASAFMAHGSRGIVGLMAALLRQIVESGTGVW